VLRDFYSAANPSCLNQGINSCEHERDLPVLGLWSSSLQSLHLINGEEGGCICTDESWEEMRAYL